MSTITADVATTRARLENLISTNIDAMYAFIELLLNRFSETASLRFKTVVAMWMPKLRVPEERGRVLSVISTTTFAELFRADKLSERGMAVLSELANNNISEAYKALAATGFWEKATKERLRALNNTLDEAELLAEGLKTVRAAEVAIEASAEEIAKLLHN